MKAFRFSDFPDFCMSSWSAPRFSTTTMARQLCDISGPLLLIADFRWTGSRYAFSYGSGNFGVGLCIRGYNWGTAYPLRRQNRELVIVFGRRSTWQAIISNVLGPQHMCTPCTWAVCPFPSPIEYNLCYIRQRLSLQAMRCDTPPTRRMRNARLICGALRCVDASGLCRWAYLRPRDDDDVAAAEWDSHPVLAEICVLFSSVSTPFCGLCWLGFTFWLQDTRVNK